MKKVLLVMACVVALASNAYALALSELSYTVDWSNLKSSGSFSILNQWTRVRVQGSLQVTQVPDFSAVSETFTSGDSLAEAIATPSLITIHSRASSKTSNSVATSAAVNRGMEIQVLEDGIISFELPVSFDFTVTRDAWGEASLLGEADLFLISETGGVGSDTSVFEQDAGVGSDNLLLTASDFFQAGDILRFGFDGFTETFSRGNEAPPIPEVSTLLMIGFGLFGLKKAKGK